MSDAKKFIKSSPKMVVAVLIALVTIAGGGTTIWVFIDKIPYATKTQLENHKSSNEHEIEDLNEKMVMFYSFKNAQDEYYLELNEEVAVLRMQMTRVEKQLDRIEGLLMSRDG